MSFSCPSCGHSDPTIDDRRVPRKCPACGYQMARTASVPVVLPTSFQFAEGTSGSVSIRLKCPCGSELRLKETQAGKRIRCSSCGVVLGVPKACPACFAELHWDAEICQKCKYDFSTRTTAPSAVYELASEESAADAQSSHWLGDSEQWAAKIESWLPTVLIVVAGVFEWCALYETVLIPRLIYQSLVPLICAVASKVAHSSWSLVLSVGVAFAVCVRWASLENIWLDRIIYQSAAMLGFCGLLYVIVQVVDFDQIAEWYRRQSEIHRAIEEAEKVRRRESTDHVIQYEVARELYDKAEYVEAVTFLEKVLSTTPDSAPALYLAAVSYEQIASSLEHDPVMRLEWQEKAIQSFKHALDATKKSGDLNKKETTLVTEKIAVLSPIVKSAARWKKEFDSLSEEKRKQIYGHLCLRSNYELQSNRFVDEFFTASQDMKVGGMANALTKISERSIEHIASHYGKSKECIKAIEAEGKRKKWPAES